MNSLITGLVVFLISFLPRIFRLGNIMTTDEYLWVSRSRQFINALVRHDWQDTLISGHPGITTMLLVGNSQKFLPYLFGVIKNNFKYPFYAKFPIALVTSLGCVLIYFLIRKIFNNQIAVISSLFIAVDPFYLAHSRVAHIDALLTTFMTISVLFLIIYFNHSKKKYLFLSAVFAGLSFLTKLPSLFLAPFTIILLFWENKRHKKTISDFLKELALFFSISLAIFITLWPATWVTPIKTIKLLLRSILIGATHFHENKAYFMGKIIHRINPFFYPISLALKLTSVSLLFSVFTIMFLSKKLKSRNIKIILFYIIFFFLFIWGCSKQGDRYLLPIFPMIDLLAAFGLFHLTSSITKCSTAASLGLIFLQSLFYLPLCPYYLAYFNPLLGGSKRAPLISTIGWGEGMNLAAKYLNKKPEAEKIVAAIQYLGAKPFFRGKAVSMKNINDANYVVFYIGALQRRFNPKLWANYKNKKPEKTIIINHIPYCQIYKVQKNIKK